MSDRAKASAFFLALDEGVTTIIRMTHLGTDMPARHFRGTLVHAPSFRWKICHFMSLTKYNRFLVEKIYGR
jgi:hypothetical protein